MEEVHCSFSLSWHDLGTDRLRHSIVTSFSHLSLHFLGPTLPQCVFPTRPQQITMKWMKLAQQDIASWPFPVPELNWTFEWNWQLFPSQVSGVAPKPHLCPMTKKMAIGIFSWTRFSLSASSLAWDHWGFDLLLGTSVALECFKLERSQSGTTWMIKWLEGLTYEEKKNNKELNM